jgi:hypothetical protein
MAEGVLRCEKLTEKSQIEGSRERIATINDISAERRKSVRFGVHAFGQFPSLPNAGPDERSGSANLLNLEPDHRSGSASVRSEPKFGTELCHHYALDPKKRRRQPHLMCPDPNDLVTMSDTAEEHLCTTQTQKRGNRSFFQRCQPRVVNREQAQAKIRGL